MQGNLPEVIEGFEIREARREDVPAIVRLLADDVLGSQREQFTDPLPNSYYVAFEGIEADPNNELLVVVHDGAVMGTFQLTFIPSLSLQGSLRVQIEAVRVDQGYRGQGVGQLLIKWTIARARQKGCHLIQLTTNKTRGDAHRFYERLGFVASHEGMKLNLD